MKLANTISSLILELISCPPQCKVFANLFTEPQHSSFYVSLSASLPCMHTFAGACLALPSCHPSGSELAAAPCTSHILHHLIAGSTWSFSGSVSSMIFHRSHPLKPGRSALVHGQCAQRVVTHQKISAKVPQFQRKGPESNI